MSTYIISRNDENDQYKIWKFYPYAEPKFVGHATESTAAFDRTMQLASIGNYLLAWGPGKKVGDKYASYPYRLFQMDLAVGDPLSMGATVQEGNWPASKFWGYRGHYTDNPNEGAIVPMVSMGNFMMFFEAGKGRGTYTLFNFDPNFKSPHSSDPLPSAWLPQGGFPDIREGHQLYCLGNYVLDRYPDGITFRIWSFDPQNNLPLSVPAIASGTWNSITEKHQIVVLGDQLLTWIPGSASYCLWSFDPDKVFPFEEIIHDGTIPEEMRSASSLTAVQPVAEAYSDETAKPGTMAYMQQKIEHVVYLMLESRSFDNVCGLLYAKNEAGINFIGSNKPFDGVDPSFYNEFGGKKVYPKLFQNGKLSTDYVLSDQSQDPFHDNSDGILQMFSAGFGEYQKGNAPDMKGFAQNNASEDVMYTLTPEQLPILNGLAANYAISDEWFSGVPGGTDINRAYTLTGSAQNRLDSWEGGATYANWPQYPHRLSLWKLLWNNGINDWCIYNNIEWMNKVFTYNLYLQGQSPSVDANTMPYVQVMDVFRQQLRTGNIPKFSFLEPIWIAPVGTTSYHPGADLVPGEVALNELFEDLKNSPAWEKTLLVISFSKNGGICDHAAPPYAAKAWKNDSLNGFQFDIMGPRVPAIFVSPLIKQKTVVRSGKDQPFDATSFPATLLEWLRIPRARWGMGDRVQQAPTFESIFQLDTPRKDAPKLIPPYDKNNPPKA
jgi:phospholipase C